MNLERLGSIQQKAVLHNEGPLMILAGAGSGKTRTLVAKLAYLLEEKNYSPYQILALTFSNKAAKEMRERVSREISSSVLSDTRSLQITTFHSFCSTLLRSEATYLGLSRNFTIYDDSESKSVMKSILGRHNISPKELSPFEVLYYIDNLKNLGHYLNRKHEAINAGEIDTNDPFYSYFCEYEAELRRANAIDFGGLITAVLQLFESFPNVLERYQERYKYILVDEYQDTNRAQFELLKMLSEKRRHICVVGDEDQSIYSWRGADIRNIFDFENVFPEMNLIKLEQNYRSGKNIITAASAVIARNQVRKDKTMWTENPEGELISIVECPDERKEAEYVVHDIIDMHKKHNVSYDDVAVFYRTNAQSRVLEEFFRQNKIPYRVVGSVRFYDRKEIKDLLAYMRLIVNNKDSLALSRIINVPIRGIGATSLRKMEEFAMGSNLSLWECLQGGNISELRLSTKVRSGLNQFIHLIQECIALYQQNARPSIIYEKLLHESGYYESLRASKDYESMARIENLEEFQGAIKQFEEENSQATLLNFLETITLDSQVESDQNEEEMSDKDAGEVSLMTVHGAKGLEFSHVFIVGVEENVFPSYKSLEDGAMAEEEERRLFYVAMTRAMKKLTICFAQGRMLFGQLKFNGPGRFINEIPSKLCHWKKYKMDSENQFMRMQRPWNSDDMDNEFNQETYNDDVGPVLQRGPRPELPYSFPIGAKVKHGLYGLGKVLKSEGLGNEEKVLIMFSDGVKKKFAVKYAPLELVK